MPVFSTLTDVKKKRENGNYSKDGGSDSDPLCCCMNYEPRRDRHGMCKPATPQRTAFFPICKVRHGHEKTVLLHLRCSQANLGEGFIVRI